MGHAQSLPLAEPGSGATALPPDTSRQIVLASGQRKSASFWQLPPGNGYALRFAAPAASQRQLISIRIHFGYFGQRLAKGNVRLRVASVAPDGRPADDNLLAKEMLITEQTLQYLDQPLLLAWPTERIVVPASGFFIVVEGVGNAPDEYVLKSPRVVLAGAGNSAIGRRNDPGAAPRPLSTWSIPELFSAKLTTVPVELWGHENENPAWQHFTTTKQVPMLEVSFR
ncbi:MAG: hypothetical protein ACRYF0_07350 [Janthinobacterium lividum]